MEQIVNSKMYILHLIEGGIAKGSKKRHHNLNGGEYQFLSVFVAACLIYLVKYDSIYEVKLNIF